MSKLRLFACLFLMTTNFAFAAAERQGFIGGGVGLEVLSQAGSGTGFYLNGFGGYNFSSMLGVGLHMGFSNVGGVDIKALDFGGFAQATDSESGLYGRLYLDAVNASVSGGGRQHGVNGSQLGFAPGIGVGMLIPSLGDFHLTPEVAYRAAFLDQTVNMITVTFNLTWDL